VWSHFKHKILISELKEEIEIYEGEYQRDQAQIHQLQSNPKAMERIARERYFMKNDGEDIFVLSEDEQSLNTNDDNEATEQD
jgi:cell division protein FtsB